MTTREMSQAFLRTSGPESGGDVPGSARATSFSRFLQFHKNIMKKP